MNPQHNEVRSPAGRDRVMGIMAGLPSLIAGGLLLTYAINAQLMFNGTSDNAFTEARIKMYLAVIGAHFDQKTVFLFYHIQDYIVLTFVIAGVVLLLSLLLITLRRRWVQRLLIVINLGVAVQYVAEAIIFHNRLPSEVDSVEGFLIWLYVGLGVFALATILTFAAGAQAASPGWRVAAVTGPTNLPPRSDEVQRVAADLRHRANALEPVAFGTDDFDMHLAGTHVVHREVRIQQSTCPCAHGGNQFRIARQSFDACASAIDIARSHRMANLGGVQALRDLAIQLADEQRRSTRGKNPVPLAREDAALQ